MADLFFRVYKYIYVLMKEARRLILMNRLADDIFLMYANFCVV